MKKITQLVVFSISTFGYFSVFAQSQDDMKAMQAYMAPGPIHQMLAKSTGTLTAAITMWMTPGGAPANMTGETKSEMILGGRYLKSTNTGNMMGMPFEGVSITGYDNAKKIFVNSWIDNMGTGMMYLEGSWDDQNKSISFKGKVVDPATGNDLPVREIVKFPDDNSQIMEMYMTANGNEFKTMEIKFTRK